MAKKISALFLLLVLLLMGLVFVLCFSVSAHGAISRKHENSIGALMYTDNPYTYKAGSITAVGLIDSRGLVVRIQPLGTYDLFTEDILFCGIPSELFLNKESPMVLTYRTQDNRMIDGIGCHELVHVDSLKPQEKLPE